MIKVKYGDKISLIILSLIILMSIIQIIFIFFMSFSNGWVWPDIIPKKLSFEAWKYVLLNINSLNVIFISLKIALIVVIINLIVAIPAADAIARYDFKYKNIIEFLLIMPIVIPPIISTMGIHKTFIRMNLTESIWGVVLVHIIPTLPYMIRAIKISFENFGFEWEHQCQMLGANKLNTFINVKIYFLLPGIIAGSTLTILISFSQYITTILIGGGQIQTLSTSMVPYINSGEKTIGCVYAIIFAFICLTALGIMEYYLKRYYDSL
ncbi:ABC transporter permease [Tepidibacter hydrothermalis]|uniref:ABC transporter permease subunit n=1 Tax=Tepidibacter hydrothermalis TaxID=3036126 RepID=A0ABY8EIE1_9FIRM|nr:ABC transporter permease subunit [Tepidibacter hydrothermalis]WFD11624.1 ABC transporter permease subunit [Tepidibacter hydrothermalis]